MADVVDGDSHFMEPLDLYERYIDPAFRDRTLRLGQDLVSGKRAMLVDNKPMKLRDVEEVSGLLAAYGQKESGRNLSNFDRYSHTALIGRIWMRVCSLWTTKELGPR